VSALQRPTATRVAGFSTWKELGRFVKKGENGIQILAPMMGHRRRKDGSDQSSSQDDAKPMSVHIGFRAVYVFERLSRDLWPGFYALDGTSDAPQGTRDGSHVIAQSNCLVQRLLAMVTCCCRF
jgi:N-terminal domain of anti-restriction factor ArdC